MKLTHLAAQKAANFLGNFGATVVLVFFFFSDKSLNDGNLSVHVLRDHHL